METNWAVECAMVKNEAFVQKAQELIPELIRTGEEPVCCKAYTGEMAEKLMSSDPEAGFGKDDTLIFDFGHNHAAYFSFALRSVGSPMDAPVFLHLKFGETEKELKEDSRDYHGWISKSWIQEEWLHIDELPKRVDMERRYAFRFVKITVVDTSQKFRVVFEKVRRTRVSAVREEDVALIETADELLKKIDDASVRTLANCMQTVFEDGPKRDRRLWLGDLQLQALANYETFQNQDLVKRCLYLFGGMPNDRGMIPACVFERPEPLMDDTFLLDYALFFIPVLAEYYQQTQDRETLTDLADIALKQIDLAMEYVEDGMIQEEGVPCEKGAYYGFIDWNEKLDKQCAMQGVLLYCLRYAVKLCEFTGQTDKIPHYQNLYMQMKNSAKKIFWDEEQQVFVSGKERQISMASQVWMTLAGVVCREKAAAALLRVEKEPIAMVTPYMHHFYVMALLECGEKKKALSHLKEYWGGMIKAGADTFWELYNPDNEKESPYGSDCVNSYCHAWSCTPAYILRKYKELLS